MERFRHLMRRLLALVVTVLTLGLVEVDPDLRASTRAEGPRMEDVVPVDDADA